MLKRMLRLVISSCLYLLDRVGDLLRAAVGVPSPGRWVVLYYHNVSAAQAVAFASQMNAALRCAVSVSPAARTSPKGKRCFSVTFDDALADIQHTALPLLKERNIPAAVFVPTGFAGREAGWQMAQGCGERGRRVMSFVELARLDARLVALGSHTVTHCRLSELSQAELERELRDSRRVLERETGRAVELLSFPHGDYDDRVLAAVLEAGYSRAFTISPGCAVPEGEAFLVGRVKADPGDWPIEFFLKIRGAYRWQAIAERIVACVSTKKRRARRGVAPTELASRRLAAHTPAAHE